MSYTIICVGKIKEKFYEKAINEYKKRLSKYIKLNIIEVADEKTPDKASEKMNNLIKEKEGERILSKISDSMYVITLEIEGKEYDSVSFSKHLEKLEISGKSNIAFVIGGSLGLGDNVLKRSNENISFSKFTFPHQLMRVIFLEQLYRSKRISNNEPYHK